VPFANLSVFDFSQHGNLPTDQQALSLSRVPLVRQIITWD
jgi:hypothetical protein